MEALDDIEDMVTKDALIVQLKKVTLQKVLISRTIVSWTSGCGLNYFFTGAFELSFFDQVNQKKWPIYVKAAVVYYRYGWEIIGWASLLHHIC